MKTIQTIAFLPLLCASLLAPTSHAADPPSWPAVSLRDFKLTGDLTGDRAAFTLTATAHVENPKGGQLYLLEGPVALTDINENPKWQIRVETNRFVATFDRKGDFPIQLKFSA